MSCDHPTRQRLLLSVCNAVLSPPPSPVHGRSHVAGLFPRPGRTVNRRNLQRQVEAGAGTDDSGERRREWSGFVVSFLVHTALIVGLSLMVTPPVEFGTAITIVTQPSTNDTTIDFDAVEIQDMPFEQADQGEAQAEAMASLAGIEEDPALKAALEMPDPDELLSTPADDDDGGLGMPDTESIFTAIGQGKKEDGLDAKGLGIKVECYGVKASGRRFIFVTDCSGSMRGQPLRRLKEQLRKSISDLPAKAEFYIVFFNDKAIPMPSSTCIQATPAHFRKYLDWADQVQNDGGTDPSQALNLALALDPSVVFLLTDGIFQPRPTLEAIEKLNRDHTVQINTIAIGERGAEPVLRRIAEENKGTYTFVPNQ